MQWTLLGFVTTLAVLCIMENVCAAGADHKAAGKEGRRMPIIFAVLGTPLAHFAEGAILGATVYLVSRGKRNQLKNKK